MTIVHPATPRYASLHPVTCCRAKEVKSQDYAQKTFFDALAVSFKIAEREHKKIPVKHPPGSSIYQVISSRRGISRVGCSGAAITRSWDATGRPTVAYVLCIPSPRHASLPGGRGLCGAPPPPKPFRYRSLAVT